jgi:NitT/TauT family transport system substrate-binding protein
MGAVKLKTGPKLVLGLMAVGLLTLGAKMLTGGKIETSGAAQKASSATKSVKSLFGSTPKIRVGVNTWPGHVGGQYFNNGFAPNDGSRYLSEYGIEVEYVLQDDLPVGRDAWKSDEIDVLWATADSWPAEIAGLVEFNPRAIGLIDWSRGGDVIVARRGISKVTDLKGKKVAFVTASPSHTLLTYLLETSDMTQDDIEPVEVGSAIDAAAYFKSGKVDAAVVWSPDDQDCLAAQPGSKVLKSTKEASNVIADIFFVKESYLKEHKDILVKWFEGHLRGQAEINESREAKEKAIKIMTEGLKQPEDFVRATIDAARRATLGDNRVFFGLDKKAGAVTGDQVYMDMREKYKALGVAKGSIPSWESLVDTSVIEAIHLEGPEHAAEKFTFKAATATVANAEAFSSKAVSVSFPSGSSTLDEDAKFTIKSSFGALAKGFASSRIRIEGNTDNVGSEELNKVLSHKRAQAVAQFLVSEYGFDADRFVVKGNGSSKPVADNNTNIGRSKNRRTDFELLAE